MTHPAITDQQVLEAPYPVLCRAWGETDLPAAFIAHNEDDLRHFIVEEWLNDPAAPVLAEVVQDILDHDWKEESVHSFEFEIGGLSFERVYLTALRARIEGGGEGVPENWFRGMTEEYRREAWRIHGQTTSPQAVELSNDDILKIAHRTASVYRHRTDPDSPSYGFLRHTIIDFARAVLAKAGIQAEKNNGL